MYDVALINNPMSKNFFSNADDIVLNVGTLEPLTAVEYIVRNIPFGSDLIITLSKAGAPCQRIETEPAYEPSQCIPCEGIDLAPPISNGDQEVCQGETAILTATVPDGQSIRWYDAPVGGNLLASNLSAYETDQGGIYYAEAIIPEAPNCPSTSRAAITLTILPELKIESCNPMPTTRRDSNDGQLDLLFSGAAPFQVSWVGPQNGESPELNVNTYQITNLGSGNYTATVLDANGCMDSCPFTITSDNPSNPCRLANIPAPTVLILGSLFVRATPFLHWRYYQNQGFLTIGLIGRARN